MSDHESWLEGPSDAPAAHPDIESLLDAGYEDLDRFARWLEHQLGLAARACERDCFNAESFIDYLANFRRKKAEEADEYDVRWFMFSHYIRKSGADEDTAERLPISLQNLYTFLQKDKGYAPPVWIWSMLDDHAGYLKRRREFADLDSDDERAWSVGFTQWCEELDDDLDARCLALPKTISHDLMWADRKRLREAALWETANTLWQEERSRLIADGMGFDEARERLLVSYMSWAETPQDRLDGKTPAETILEEQQEAADSAESELLSDDEYENN